MKLNCKLYLLMSLLICMGCDSFARQYQQYKQSRLIPVAHFDFLDADDTTPQMLAAKMKQCGIKIAMESDLGICSVSVDKSDVKRARNAITRDSELQKRGVTLYDD